jgi:leucyl aminopeptidase
LNLEIYLSKDYTVTINKVIKTFRAQLQTLALVDLFPNKVTPKYLANWAQDKGDKYGFEVKVLGLEACQIEGPGAF